LVHFALLEERRLMDEQDVEWQQRLHDVIEDVMHEQGDLPEGRVLTGWTISYETASLSGENATAGHFYGPREMTSWRALGLLEWSKATIFDGMRDNNEED
jgi:hypothetical protein